MAEGASIGEVHVSVVPRAINFWNSFQAQTQAGASRAGEQLGAAVGRGIQDRIAAGMVDGVTRGGRNAAASGAKSGAEVGEAFGKSAKARIEAALKSLPDVKIDGDSSKLDKKVAAIRAELKALDGKNIGVDIADDEAQARLAALRTQMSGLVRDVQKLKETGKDVPINLDAIKALAEVSGLKREFDSLRREAAKPIRVPVEVDQASLSRFEQTMQRRLKAATSSFGGGGQIGTDLASLSNKRIGIDIDSASALNELSRLRAQLDELAARSPNVQIRTDAAAAAAQLAAFQAEVSRLDGRTANVNVNADTAGATAGLFAINGASQGASGGIAALIAVGAAIGPAIVPAAAAAAAAIGAIGPAAAVGAAGIGVVALAAVPVIGAVKAMSDAQNASGTAAVSAAGKQSQMAAAIDGVRSAQASLANATANAAEAQRRATQQVENAERDLATAQAASLRAQQAINGAREEARRSLEDLASRQAGVALDQRRSTLDIAKAEDDLAKARAAAAQSSSPTNNRAVAEAQLALDEQIQRSKDLSVEQKRLAADKADADRKGIDGSKQVVAATQNVTQAQERVRAAEQAVADARIGQANQARQSAFAVAQAQQGVVNAQRAVQQASVSAGTAGGAAMNKLQKAMEALSPAGVAFATFLFGLKSKFGDLSKVAQEGLLPGLQAGITALLPVMPQVVALVGLMAQTMGDLFAKAGPVIAEFLPRFLTMIGQVAPPLMDAFTRILLAVGTGFGDLIIAFAPFAVVFFDGLARLAEKFSSFAQGLASNPAFQQFIGYVTEQGPKLLTIFGNLGVVIGNLLIALAPFGSLVLDGLVWLTDQMTKLSTLDLQIISAGLIAIAVAIGVISVAMAANPITLIVIGVGAVIAALVLAYNHFAQFRAVVDTVAAAWLQFATFMLGIYTAIWQNAIQPVLSAWWTAAQQMAQVYMWLWQNAIVPAWNGISAVIQFAWATIIQPIFGDIRGVIANILAPTFLWLWNNVVQPVWSGISLAIQVAWTAIQIVFGLFQIELKILAAVFGWLWENIIRPVWSAVAAGISLQWESTIRPIFMLFASVLRDYVAPTFRSAVDAIGVAWDMLRAKAREPVAFVVNSVINPLISGYNDLAKVFGTNHVEPIKGFAYGGYISGPGGPRDDLIPAMLSNGEYVIPANVVRTLGVGFFDQLIGQPTARYPGDGSNGLAFADGGLVGFFKDVWTGITNPGELLKKPIDAALGAIPGGGTFKTLLAGMGHKLVDGLLGWLGGASTPEGMSPGNVGRTQAFVKAQAGKPYVWASAGPGGYDCSGLLSAAWLTMHGKNPYSHIFSTSNEAGYFPLPGPGPFTAGWTNPGERGPGGNSVGHTAGVIGGMPFESRGGDGVVVGRGVTNVNSFAHVGHFADGGPVRFGVYDSGGTLPPGLTLAYNGTGQPETIRTAGQEAGLRGGVQSTINVYPQAGQSEQEIAAAASRELSWQLR